MNYLDRFESRLKEEWKRTPTIDVYLRSVRFFEKWYTESVNDDFEPDNITALDIQDWRQHMQIQDKLHPTTINKRISSLKVYWSFLVDQGFATVDVARNVKVSGFPN